jgi:DNA-binding NarL/FixJ family response regulator
MSVPTAKIELVPTLSTPFIGRVAELTVLTSVLEDAMAGIASGVVLSADAGVGKTRLLTEVVALAQARGMVPVIGHCLDFGDAGLPYLAFSEAFGRLATEHPGLADEIRVAYPAISRLLPARRLMDANAEGDSIERGVLFDAVLGALTALSAQLPVLLVLEDVHWADQSSRDLLGFLFSRLRDDRIAIIASYRSDDVHRRHPLRAAAAAWTRLQRVRRLQLPLLNSREITALVASISPQPVSSRMLGRIVARAEGNAFFAEDLLAATAQSSDPDSVPAELADLLLLRVDQLSNQSRQVVRTAAVAGRRVPHALLAAVAGLDEAAIEIALREAVEAHVLEPAPGSGYVFRHALLAEAVYDDLLPGERVRLHSAYAAALEDGAMHGTAAELARHARESHDLATALTASVRAGQEAMNVAAPQEAMRHFEAALELLPRVPVVPIGSDGAGDAQAVDPIWLVVAAADAAYAAGHQYRAMGMMREALARLPETITPEQHATLLHRFATFALTNEADNESFTATADALRILPRTPASALRARVGALHARAAMALGRDVDAARWAQYALALAGDLDQPAVAAEAQTTLAILERRSGDMTEAAALMQLGIDQARSSGDIAAELRSRYNLGTILYEQGDLSAALEFFRVSAERARDTGRQWAAFGLESRMLIGLVQYERGDWDASLETVQIGAQPPPPMAEAGLVAVAMAVHAGRGELRALDSIPLLRRVWHRDGMLAVLGGGAGFDLYAGSGRLREGLALLDEVVDVLGQLWETGWFLARIRLAALALGALADALSQLPESARAEYVTRAQTQIEAARETAISGLPQGRRLGIEGRAWLARAEAEWARMRWLAAVDAPDAGELIDLWQRAVEGFGYGHVYEQARSRVALAQVLRAGGEPGAALEQAQLAADVAQRVGATPLLARARALGSGRTVPVATPVGGLDSLTAREREVLALLVEGRTNRQVAGQLFISEKTVSVHVSNLLAKLGVNSRAEAAALARRSGPSGAGGQA